MSSGISLISVIGMGLDGLEGLTPSARQCLEAATVIAGSDRLLKLVPHSVQTLPFSSDLEQSLQSIETLATTETVVILASGDPLFYGIGRLLLTYFSPGRLRFYPHISSVQLAFSRLGIPWQTATIVSVHGRDPELLDRALKRGDSPIAILTDGVHTPGAIAQQVQELRLPVTYKIWVCSDLGAPEESLQALSLEAALTQTFSALNIVVLEKIETPPQHSIPLFGIADQDFHHFADQPGLITKQEVRVLTLGLLRLVPDITVWDIGAGTGSLSIEIARLVPSAHLWAIEQRATGVSLIHQNCDRFQVNTIQVIAGSAPSVLAKLPDPHRIVLGGGGRHIAAILDVCCQRLQPQGVLVANFATLESCVAAQSVLRSHQWPVHLLQVNLARSATLSGATRFVPLNPVLLLQATKP